MQTVRGGPQCQHRRFGVAGQRNPMATGAKQVLDFSEYPFTLTAGGTTSLLGVGTVGAAVAALQVPKLFGECITVDNTIVSAISTAQQQAGMQAGLLSTTNPLWIGIAAMVVFSLAAVATMERA